MLCGLAHRKSSSRGDLRQLLSTTRRATRSHGQGHAQCRGNRASIRHLTTPARSAARVALHAGAVAHQREISALAAAVAFIALDARFGAPGADIVLAGAA